MGKNGKRENIMGRKLDMINASSEGKPVNLKRDNIEHELDSVDSQLKTLEPDTVTVPLIDGTKVELPVELTLEDIFKNKVMNSVRFFYFLMQSVIKDIKGEKPMSPNDPLFFGILFEESVQEAMAKLVATVTRRNAADFSGKFGPEGAVEVFKWVLKMITGKTKPSNEEPQDPKQ
jgi:hypothetical protein